MQAGGAMGIAGFRLPLSAKALQHPLIFLLGGGTPEEGRCDSSFSSL